MAGSQEEFQQIWNNAIAYYAPIFINELGITNLSIGGPSNLAGNIWTHDAVSQTWHESNHTDPTAYFTQYGRTFAQFVAELQSAINNLLPKALPVLHVVYMGKTIPCNAHIEAGVTFCQLRLLIEGMGRKVTFDDPTKTITIT